MNLAYGFKKTVIPNTEKKCYNAFVYIKRYNFIFLCFQIKSQPIIFDILLNIHYISNNT